MSSGSSGDTRPNHPSNLTAAVISATQISLTWIDYAVNETGFVIERKTLSSGSDYSLLTTLGPNVTSYLDTGLIDGETYYYRIKANNANGSSASIEVPIMISPPWTSKSPGSNPLPRAYHAMAYDSNPGKVVLFGGYRYTGTDIYYQDTWEWDGTDWTQRSPGSKPPARSSHAMAYDSSRNETILFGGWDGSVVLSDTWEWNGTNWQDVSPGGTEGVDFPTARNSHTLVYDSVRSVTVLFGGYGAGYLNDTWEWDGANWTDVTPGTKPSVRSNHAMAYISATGKTVLFGGWNNPTRFSSTWEWDGADWIQKFPSSKPSSRYAHAMAYDSVWDKVILFGGRGFNPTYKNDTWEWNGTNWVQRSPANPPSARRYHAMAYDSVRDKIVLFGGYDGTYKNDTWEYGY